MADARLNQELRPFHTRTPRLITAFAPLMLVVLGVILGALESRGLVATIDESVLNGYEVDPAISRGLGMLTMVAFVLPVFAWGWWYVAAMSNARSRSIHAGSPMTFPLAIGVIVVSVLGLDVVPSENEGLRLLLGLFAFLGYVTAAYGVLFSVRKSAIAIRGEARHWTRLLWLPWAAAVSSLVLLGIATATQAAVVAVVGVLLPLAIAIWAWVTFCMGMASFDRACRAHEVPRDLNTDLPAFLTGQKAVR